MTTILSRLYHWLRANDPFAGMEPYTYFMRRNRWVLPVFGGVANLLLYLFTPLWVFLPVFGFTMFLWGHVEWGKEHTVWVKGDSYEED